jgi:hypothetical protein
MSRDVPNMEGSTLIRLMADLDDMQSSTSIGTSTRVLPEKEDSRLTKEPGTG